MVYRASQLLALLNCLDLVGIEDGQLQWEGKKEQWEKVDREEERILKEYYGKNYF